MENKINMDIQSYSTNSNYKLLKKNHSSLLKRIEAISPEPTGKIVFNSDNKPNLMIYKAEGNSGCLHPERDPESEVDFFLQKIPENFSGVEIILGMGLGYGVLGIHRLRKNLRSLIIIEHDSGIFLQALKYMDLTLLLSDPRVIIITSPEINFNALMRPANKAISFEDTQILQNPGSLALLKEEYQNIYDLIFSYCNEYNILGATKMKYGKIIVQNRFDNLKSMGNSYLLENLQNKFKDIPAYIVAGGPSLDKNVHLLKKVQNKAVIICVDTALPALHDRGIKPDFVTSIDYKNSTYEKFAHIVNELSNDIALIVYSWAAPKVTKNFPGNKKIFLFTESNIENWINSLINGKKVYPGASSVANLNFIAAVALGCSPVIFVGQDLAFSSEQSHFSSAVLTVRDQVAEWHRTKKDLIWIQGVNGEKVPTTRGMKNIQEVFERFIHNHPGYYINCSEGGVHIKGTQYIDLEEVVNIHRSDTISVSDKLKKICIKDNLIDSKNITDKLEEDLKTITLLLQKSSQNNKMLKKAQHGISIIQQKKSKQPMDMNQLPQKIQKQVKKIDEINHFIDGFDKIWGIVEDVTAKGLSNAERLNFDIEKVAGNSKQYIKWLDLSLKRLKYVNDVRQKTLEMLEQGIKSVINHIKKEIELPFNKNVSNIDTLLDIARLHMASKDYQFVRPVVEKILSIMPDSAEANYYLGCIQANIGLFDKVNHYFDKTLLLDSGYQNKIKEFRTALGEEYIEYAEHFKDYDMIPVKNLLLKGLKYCPFHKGIQNQLHAILENEIKKIKNAAVSGEISKFRNTVETWINEINSIPQLHVSFSNQQIADLHCAMGEILFHENSFNKASEHFNKALVYIPQDSALLLNICDLFFCSSMYDEGILYLNKAIALDNKHALHWEQLGDFLIKSKKFLEAATAYEQCYHFFPEQEGLKEKTIECFIQHGNTLHKNGLYVDAAEIYTHALNLNPESSSQKIVLFNNTGSAYQEAGNYNNALFFYDKALELNPDYGEAIYNKGCLLQILGNLNSAMDHFNNVIRLNPDFIPAYKKKAAVLQSMGRYQESEELLRQAELQK